MNFEQVEGMGDAGGAGGGQAAEVPSTDSLRLLGVFSHGCDVLKKRSDDADADDKLGEDDRDGKYDPVPSSTRELKQVLFS